MDKNSKKLVQAKNTLEHLSMEDMLNQVGIITDLQVIRQIALRFDQMKYFSIRDIGNFTSESFFCFQNLGMITPQRINQCLEYLEAEKKTQYFKPTYKLKNAGNREYSKPL